jgi:hypothetical protein
VRRTLTICVAALMMAFGPAAAQQSGVEGTASDFVGTWIGTWEGGGSGGFELTLEKGEAGKLGGRVSVTGEPTYKATLKTVAFNGNKMTATYDFPPDPNIGITLEATFDGKAASGTWAARQSGGSDVASGTWTVKRQ